METVENAEIGPEDANLRIFGCPEDPNMTLPELSPTLTKYTIIYQC